MKESLKEQLTFVPVEEVSRPRDGVFRVVVDAWWIMSGGQVMFFRGHSPQCNANREVAERIRKSLYPECEIVQVPVAYVPWRD